MLRISDEGERGVVTAVRDRLIVHKLSVFLFAAVVLAGKRVARKNDPLLLQGKLTLAHYMQRIQIETQARYVRDIE